MSGERVWHLHTTEGTMGPYTADELRGWYGEGRLRNESMVWRDGTSSWVALSAAGILAAPAPVAAAAATAAPSDPGTGSGLPSWARTPIEFRKQFFKLLGAGFRGYDAAGNVVIYCEQKAFKLKEDLRVYADEAKTQEILRIGARQVLDIAATYDIRDAKSGAKIGAMRRKGLMSTFVQDQWLVLDDQDREIGMVQEDSALLGMIRKHVLPIIPQKFTYTIGGAEVANLQQAFNPILFRATLNITGKADPRLLVAATTLILAIEGRQR